MFSFQSSKSFNAVLHPKHIKNIITMPCSVIECLPTPKVLYYCDENNFCIWFYDDVICYNEYSNSIVASIRNIDMPLIKVGWALLCASFSCWWSNSMHNTVTNSSLGNTSFHTTSEIALPSFYLIISNVDYS